MCTVVFNCNVTVRTPRPPRLLTDLPEGGAVVNADRCFLLSSLEADFSLHQLLSVFLNKRQTVQLFHDAVLHLRNVGQRSLAKHNTHPCYT